MKRLQNLRQLIFVWLLIGLTSIGFAQDITFTSPTAADQLKFGEVLTIEWDNSTFNGTDSYSLFYREVGATNWTAMVNRSASQLSTGVGNEMSYDWTVPDFGSDLDRQVEIRVVNNTESYEGISPDFRVFFQSSVEVVSPTAIDQYKFGDEITISWDNGDIGSSDYFQFYYQNDDGNFVNFLNRYIYQVTTDGNTSTTTWNVSDFGADIDSDFRIRILNSTRQVMDTSETFRVYFEPVVDILTPTSLDEVKFGDQITVSWKNGDIGTSDYFQLFYKKDDGNYVNFINRYIYQLTNNEDTSSYTWTIPDFGADSASIVDIRVLNSTRSVADTSDGFRVYYEPFVEIISPTSIDELKFGEQVTIKWKNGDIGTSDYYQLFYRKDDGNYVNFINRYIYQLTNDEDTSSYTWTIPDFGADSASIVDIRVLNSTRSVADTSEGFRVYYEPFVEMISPTSLDELKFGDQVTIKWKNGDIGTSDYYQLFYRKDDGNYVNFINRYIYQLTNNGDTSSYTWTIPDFGADSASLVDIRVLNSTRAVADTTEAFRVYYEPFVEMISPTALDEFKFGDQVTIKWKNGDIGTSDYYQLFYRKDDGSYTNFINRYIYQLTNNGDTSSYTWTMPDFGADSASLVDIRVLNSTRAVSDTTDAFRVYYQPSVEMISPFEGQFALQGSPIDITWDNGDIGSSDYFQLFYSVDGGAYTNFVNRYIYQLSNDGTTSTYTWTTPAIESTDVKVRVLNSTRAVSDTTLSFTICLTCPAIAVYYPNGGEVLGVGKNVQIGWSVGETWEPTDQIKIELSLDGGTTYESTAIYDGDYSNISENVFDWTVSNNLTSNAKIKVTNVTQGASDESNNVFTIVTPPAIPSDFFALENPNGTVTLSWTDNEVDEENYAIEYSNDTLNWYGYSGLLGPDVETYTTPFIGNAGYWWRVRISRDGFSEYSVPRFAGNYNPPARALNFDGTDDYIAISEPPLGSGYTGAFTLEAWVKPESLSTGNGNWGQAIIRKAENEIEGDFMLTVLNDGRLGFLNNRTGDVDQSGFHVTQDVVIEEGKWIYVAAVWDGTENHLYVNGIPQSFNSSQSGTPWGEGFDIGRGWTNASYYFDGDIDEVRVWSVARTENELNEHLYQTLDGNESGLAAYYRFDQSGTSTILPDRTINNHHGSWMGTGNPAWVSSGALTDYTPVISVTYPDGGENFVAGNNYNITWATQYIDASDLIEIQLSTDGGANYSILNDGTFGTYNGQYEWTVPNTPTTDAYIKVVNTTENVADSSDAAFNILPPPATITVTEPNGGEFYLIGETYTVTWDTENVPGTDLIEIRVSTDGGTNFSILNDGTFDMYNGSYEWTVSNNPSGSCLIEIANTTQSVSDRSNGFFTIGEVNPQVTVLTPNGGEELIVGTNYNITWTAQDISGSDLIDIQLSTDNGDTYATIADGSFDMFNGTYEWTVPNSPSTEAIIKVVNLTENVSDSSDAVFTIGEPVPTITLLKPNGGESLATGQLYNIEWETQNIPGTDLIEILYSDDGGDTYTFLNDGTFDMYEGAYEWTVPGVPTENGIIKIVNSTQDVADSSAAVFTIAENVPAITVTSPNGGEIWTVGQVYSVNWTTQNIPTSDLIEIRLSTDGGTNYSMINDGTFGTYNGSYEWTVPNLPTENARIQIANTTQSITDASDADFIIAEEPLSVEVSNPNGGEIWEVGQSYTISWFTEGFDESDLIQISVSLDSGATSTIISQGLNNTYEGNEYVWTVDTEESERAIIIVRNDTKDLEDQSDDVFAIRSYNRSITVTSPNGGEIWYGDATYTVSWESTDMAANDVIEFAYSLDNGENFTFINDGNFGSYPDNTYQWTVPDNPGNQAIFRVRNSTWDVEDVSDAVFTIKPAPDLTPSVFNSQPTAEIVGDHFEFEVSINEPGTLYYLILNDGQNVPNSEEIKAAAEGGEALTGQVTAGVVAYPVENEPLVFEDDTLFTRFALYDFYFAALDTAENLNSGISRANVVAQLTPLEKDSTVVDIIYQEMGGENWTNIAENWIELPMSQREEITFDERITALDFTDKNLTATIPFEVRNLDSLETLRMDDNQITGMVNLTNLIKLSTFSVAGNHLDFGDLEQNSSLFSETEEYSPQFPTILTVEQDSLTQPRSSDYLFNFTLGGENTSYSWIVDYFSSFEEEYESLEEASSGSYFIADLDFENMGSYAMRATNSQLPGLELSSDTVQLWATARLAITVFGEGTTLLPEGAAYALRDRGPGKAYDSIPKEVNGTGDPKGLVFSNGDADFGEIILGDYLISIRGDAEKFLPTYYENTYLWEEAEQLVLRGPLEDTMFMFNLPPPLGPDDGSGEVEGEVETNFDDDGSGRILGRRKAKRAGCSMRRLVRKGRTDQEEEYELIAYVESDDEGKFDFGEFIPAGTYRFNIEYPGIPMDTASFVQFEITEEGFNQRLVLQATITEEGVFVERVNTLGFAPYVDDISVYPNPTSDWLNIRIQEVNAPLEMSLYSLSGDLIYRAQYENNQSLQLQIDVRDARAGLYLLDIRDTSNTANRATYRVMIR